MLVAQKMPLGANGRKENPDPDFDPELEPDFEPDGIKLNGLMIGIPGTALAFMMLLKIFAIPTSAFFISSPHCNPIAVWIDDSEMPFLHSVMKLLRYRRT